MSSLVKKVESDAEKAFEQNSTSLTGPRAVYSQALEKRLKDLQQVNSAKEKVACEEDICNLYVSRAAMEINFKQKKQAKLVFDEALKHDFCNRSTVVWKAYINFCILEGKVEVARKLLQTAVESVDPSTVQQMWEFWVQFERNQGRKDLTIKQLKAEVYKTAKPTNQSSTISDIHKILTDNGTIDITALNDNNGRSIHREHRPMGIFQEPPPDLDHINDQEEAPDIPNRVLYYLAVVMSDPQMSQLIVTLHKMHKSYIEELDLSQQRAYDSYYKKYKVYDISPEEVKQRSENDMAGQYKKESEGLEKMTRDFQDYLNEAGVPGFSHTEDRNQLKIQRHFVKLMQLVAQYVERNHLFNSFVCYNKHYMFSFVYL